MNCLVTVGIFPFLQVSNASTILVFHREKKKKNELTAFHLTLTVYTALAYVIFFFLLEGRHNTKKPTVKPFKEAPQLLLGNNQQH